MGFIKKFLSQTRKPEGFLGKLICVNYDGFDKNNTIFSDMLSVTGKIEEYILNHHNGRVDEDIYVEGTRAHFIYARKMGKKY